MLIMIIPLLIMVIIITIIIQVMMILIVKHSLTYSEVVLAAVRQRGEALLKTMTNKSKISKNNSSTTTSNDMFYDNRKS